LALLQARLPAFYPEKAALLRQINTMASGLGGKLAPPLHNRRSRLLQRLLGPEWGRALMICFRRLRMAGTVKWDELMDRFGL
jgi:hypothetical protein